MTKNFRGRHDYFRTEVLPRWMEWAVAGVCGYEAFVLFSRLVPGTVPTISALCWKHRSLTVLIVFGLTAHLLRKPTEKIIALVGLVEP